MTRMLLVLAVMGLLIGLTGCEDPEPGEISVIATKSGKQQACAVQLLNEKGIQLNLIPTDIKGMVYIKKLAPGNYTLKFQDRNEKLYPAVKSVTVTPGDSVVCRVDLNEEPPIEAGVD